MNPNHPSPQPAARAGSASAVHEAPDGWSAQARPTLRSCLHRMWRDRRTLQLGLDPGRAVLVTGLDPSTSALVEYLDGTHDLPEVYRFAQRLDLPAGRVDEVLRVLGEGGVLEDAATRPGTRGLPGREHARLRPDRAAAALLRNRRDCAEALFARRRCAAVSVHGAGRLGSQVVALLAAAGVGHVSTHDPRPLTAHDCMPGGLTWKGTHTTREQAVRDMLRHVAPSVRPTLPRGRSRPDVAVVIPEGRPNPVLAARLVHETVPHLFADVREVSALVGPFVLPGRSACARCLDLHRTDRDPRWPAMLAQIVRSPGPGVTACDGVLAVSAAATTVMQVLSFLDGDSPSLLDRTWEITLPSGEVRERGWCRNPGCDCWRRTPVVTPARNAARRPATAARAERVA